MISQLSRTTCYAIEALRWLDDHNDRPSLIDEVAAATAIPRFYLGKVVNLLSRAGLIRTHRGRNGGIELGRDDQDITLLDILRALEGTHWLEGCLMQEDSPGTTRKRSGLDSPVLLNRKLEQHLKGIRLADLRVHKHASDGPGNEAAQAAYRCVCEVRARRKSSGKDTASPAPLPEVRPGLVRFAGDFRDGMQLVGSQFVHLARVEGAAIRTWPDFPEEVHAPSGSLEAVTGFQLDFGERDATPPGTPLSVLVVMNPAALKRHLDALQPGGILIANQDEFTADNLQQARYETNPLEDGSLEQYQVIPVPITRLNAAATQCAGLTAAQRAACKNFLALGIVLWLHHRPLQPLFEWLMKMFNKTPNLMAAHSASLRTGYWASESWDHLDHPIPLRRTAGGDRCLSEPGCRLKVSKAASRN